MMCASHLCCRADLMHGDDLVPLKRVLEHIGIGRVTLWRALNSGLEIPKSTIVRLLECNFASPQLLTEPPPDEDGASRGR